MEKEAKIETELKRLYPNMLNSLDLMLESVRNNIQHYIYEDRNIVKVLKLQNLEKTIQRTKELFNVNQSLLSTGKEVNENVL